MSRRRTRRREILFDWQQGRCYWCNGAMTFFERVPNPAPPRAAVLFHLDDKYSPHRGSHAPGTERTVLCCRACANEVSTEMQDWVSVDERRERAGRYPQREASA